MILGVVVEEAFSFTLLELSRASRASTRQLTEWVGEGVLVPTGGTEGDWQFDGGALRRARLAVRLSHDLELNTADTAFVLGLLDEIEALKARLRRIGG